MTACKNPHKLEMNILPRPQIKVLAEFCKTLSSPIRIELILLLHEGELCVCDLLPHFSYTQAAISKHLKSLVDGKILQYRQEGKKNMYSIRNPEIFQIIENIRKFF
ncbi:ArsR/SmtB family transcription factor [Candidatus Lokiarchaeum ossiferum]|uniref:ArsR/SmtB family transcription factor n=1 Tax=Candidatus Lokiarchaeum ossiferum TaxID=2951803 RepID=UPI00352D762C